MTGLWGLSHREEKYLAIRIARLYADFVTPRSLALYKRLIQAGAWWDFVDEIAIHLVGRVLYHHRPAVSPTLDAWITDQDMWLRRTALLSQIHHKGDTDEGRLFGYCLQTADETAFFIRKAIGWALRDYSGHRARAGADISAPQQGTAERSQLSRSGQTPETPGLSALSRSACAHEAVPEPCGRPRHCRVTAAGESAGQFSV